MFRSNDKTITFFGNDSAHLVSRDICKIIAAFIANCPDPIKQYEKIAPMAVGCPEIYQAFKRVFSQALCQYVVYGDQINAEKMIKAYPDLLFCDEKVTDYSSRDIRGTPLRMALGAEDVKFHKKEVCMVEMIHQHLRKLPNGEEIIAQQTAEQFPEGWEQREAERQARDRVALNQVISTIANPSGNNDAEQHIDIEKAIQAFRDYLAAENNGKGKVFHTGKHFNHQLLDEAFNLYKTNYDSFGGYDNPKNNFVWRKVIGTIQRYVPASTAQALCTGLGRMVYEGCNLERKLKLYNEQTRRDISYFPLDTDTFSILGRDFAVYSFFGCGAGGAGLVPSCVGRLLQWLYVKQKHQTCISYTALTYRPEHQTRWCVIS